MRCHQARKRLIAARGRMALYGHDRELLDHLRQCRECALLAQAEQTMRRDLDTAAPDDNVDVVGLPAFRKLVEARAAGIAKRNYRETNRMSEMVDNLRRRPRVSLTLGLAVVVLLFVTLVPMKWDSEVGYEVALAGVDKNLAMDQFRIQQLLDKLGIENANIQLGNCEATCKLTIGDLKNEREVKIVTTAFDELGNCVLEFVEPVMGEHRGSLAGQMKNAFFHSQSDPDDETIHKTVIACLTELQENGEGFSIWVTDSSCGQTTVDLMMQGDSITMNQSMQMLLNAPGGPDIQIVHNDPDGMTLNITDEDGVVHEINLEDPGAIEQLEALGLNVQTLVKGDSTVMQMVMIAQCDSAFDTDGDGSAKVGQDAVPEDFSLAQNYPNPFNPNTTIEFTLAAAGHTSLDIYNIQGQKVKTLVDDVMTAGEHTVEWNATDESGSRVASGVYFYRLTAGDYTLSKKMTLLK
ncbi:MAG: FlgD immunoglobulin-like domain containing protein [bacterium]